ncbi:DNA polymerase III subunit delta [uncultured bacterium]|nr:DNA polymerase III subunit delta [uncultured bacterium]
MRLKSDQLFATLSKGLAPIYLLSGDEPLQLLELEDAVRKTARQQGYNTREVLTVETGFSWHDLATSADSLSIFSDKKIIECRVPNNSVGTEGAKALIAYCEHVPDDTVLIISIAKLDSKTMKTRWVEAIDKIGVIVQVWALEGQDLLNWLQQRLRKRGLQVEPDGLRLLAARTEGNLLAANQEIEKLYVLFGEGRLSTAQLMDAVADSSRYDVFKLTDSILFSNINRILKILNSLKAEGIASPVILWALSRETRTLIKMKLAIASGQNKETGFRNHQIWDKRKALVDKALTRITLDQLNQLLVLCAKADRQIKGQQSGDEWQTLLDICLKFASAPLPERL